jgi:molybdopterin/thiamine biosynthesis adenylyltransferase
MTSMLQAPSLLWEELRADLLSTPELERAGVGFAGICGANARTRLLLRDWLPLDHDDYLVQLGYHLEVSPRVWARAAKRSRDTGEAIVIFHSHPRDGQPSFSASDDAGERAVVPKIHARARVPVGAVVISPVGYCARISIPGTASSDMRLSTPGQFAADGAPNYGDERFDRQVRALTRQGQAVLSELRVGVVGAGGLGSHVVQQLVHLGIGEVVVIDPDRVAASNLSRLVGAGRCDALLRRAKVKIARRTARRVGGPSKVQGIKGSVIDRAGAEPLLTCDVIVGCTDNQSSRVVLNLIAYQYYVPVLDLGVELQHHGAMGGRVSWLAPGAPCLWCLNVLDADRVRAEQLPAGVAEVELNRGYISGIDEPAPAVVSLNGVIASLGVSELLARTTGFAGSDARANLLMYRVADGSVRRISPEARAQCPTCSVSGILGAGDLANTPW